MSATTEDRLPPVRGLVCCANHRGALFPQTAIKQWLHLSQSGFKAGKVDLLVEGLPHERVLDLLDFAGEAGLPCSLRVRNAPSAEAIAAYQARGALDLCFAPAVVDAQALESVVAACAQAALPLRLLITGLPDPRARESLLRLAKIGKVSSVAVAPYDPFLPLQTQSRDAARGSLDGLIALAQGLKANGVETSLLRLPFCTVPRDLWPETLTAYQFYLHHQQYLYEAYDLAQTIFACRPSGMATAIEHHLSSSANFYNIIDKHAFPRMISHPTLHARLWLINKIRRKLSRRNTPGVPLAEKVSAYEAALEERDREAKRALGPACAACDLRKICDHGLQPFKAALPGIQFAPQQEADVLSPLHFNRLQYKVYDAVDQGRADALAAKHEIEAEAKAIVDGVLPTRVFKYDEFDIDGHWTDRLIGAVRWWSLSTDPMRSTPLARVELPFTIGVTFGGGMADQIGFTFGEHIHLLCPMISPTHHVALHVRRDGSYVLLRDGQAVRPTEFTGVFRVPSRLGNVLFPRISIWNVDGHIQTQSPQLWLNSELPTPDLSRIEHSVIVASTRYSRRLQALILGVAHQANYDLGRIEVIVSYVPGLDSNDDVLDSIEATFPNLRIVRCTFTERHARSRGLMVNEAVKMSSGKWITLFDSDIVVPTDFYARLDAVPEGTMFVAPDGRKMLPPDITAQILLGERPPWEDFQSFLDGPGELWHQEAGGVPVGFCQIARREVLQEFPFAMADHFEGSDWDFSQRVLAKYGKEHRMTGCYVLHLDHGGSQWYGVRKQK